MAERSETPIPTWESWLITDKQELDGLPDTFRTELVRLGRRPAVMENPNTLQEAYLRLEGLLPMVSDEQAAPWMAKIAERMEKAATKSGGDTASAIKEALSGTIMSPEAFARAMGIAGSEEILELYRRAEAQMMLPEIGIGNEPKFLIGKEDKEKDYWAARARLSNACAIKKSTAGFDKLFPNDFAGKVTLKDLELLIGEKSGTWAALCLYSAMIASVDSEGKNWDPRAILLKHKTGEHGELTEKKNAIRELCPKSVYEIKNEDQFYALKAAMVCWLRTEVELGEDEARDAEQIAWNIIYFSNLVEDNDSRFIRPAGTGRIPNGPVLGLKSPATWMIMHPQERLEGKVKGDENDITLGGESWGSFGDWALNLQKTRRNTTPEILPRQLITNAFNTEAMAFMNGEYKGRRLFDVLLEKGKNLAKGNMNIGPRPKLTIKETPFSGYYFDAISPAISIFGVIAKGGSKDNSIVGLGDAFRKTGENRGRPLTRKEKETIVMAWVGIKSTSYQLTPAMGWGSWRDFIFNLERTYAPNLFKD